MLINTSSSLVDLISHEDWNLARMELREKPAEARQWVKRTGFFDGQHQSTVLPIHICVALQPTPEFVDCLINAYPEGLKSVEPSVSVIFSYSSTSMFRNISIYLFSYTYM